MYFPHVDLIPFLRSVDNTVKQVINLETLQEADDAIIKVYIVLLLCFIVFTVYIIGCTRESTNTN